MTDHNNVGTGSGVGGGGVSGGGGGGSGITVGTTTITGGVSGKVLYDNNGVVGETTLPNGGLLSGAMSAVPTVASMGLSSTYNPQAFITATNTPTGVSFVSTQQAFAAFTAFYKAAPTAPFTVTALLAPLGMYQPFTRIGLGFLNSSPATGTGSMVNFTGANTDSTPLEAMNLATGGFSGYLAQVFVGSGTSYGGTSLPRFLRVSYDGATALYQASQDGATFYTVASVADPVATNYANIALFIWPQGGAGSGQWFELTPVGVNVMSWVVS